MLIAPGARHRRRCSRGKLRARAGADPERPPVGLVGRGDWAREDWDLANAAGIRAYLNEQELTDAVALVAGHDGQLKVDENLGMLRRTVGSPSLPSRWGSGEAW